MKYFNERHLRRLSAKKSRLTRSFNNNSGIILLVVLWTMVVLTTLAISLGRQTHVELTLAKHAIGKLKSKYLAWAGVISAIDQIRQDGEDAASAEKDTLYYCGIPIKESPSPQDLFEKVELEDGTYSVQYVPEGEGISKGTVYYGLQDEERRLNLNGLTNENKDILIALLALLGHDEDTAKTIALAIIDWRDEDSMSTDSIESTEDDYYTGLSNSYHCKNHPLDTTEELLLIKGVTPQIYKDMAPFVTVFPKTGEFQVNFDTASETILKALTHSVAGPATGTEVADADSLVEKMLTYRAGGDGLEFTPDDQSIDINQFNVNAKERVLFLVINQFRANSSQYLAADVVGIDKQRGARTHVQAIIQREDLSIVSWRRQ
jgi:general secretion pathway protein K